ncbi:MAG: bifunctional 2-C-methyl-D-erythritol 4-phosphate cytidylyltransferase/2-C-methyl-D-erythritol 2,4-cyclodiphosphate synthase [Pseudomonadota bacterium]
MSETAVVIVAAGRGARMGSEHGPKQYLMLGDQTVLQHTINCFAEHPEIALVQVVIHAEDGDVFHKAVAEHPKLLPPVIGGKTRQASCKAGIDALPSTVRNVLVHDGARPFVSAATISGVIAGIAENTCSLPATAVADTVKRSLPGQSKIETVDRDGLFLAQTPQGFVLREISAAHERAAHESDREFTDDAAVAEWAGMQVRLVQGDPGNFKITTPSDLATAQQRKSSMNDRQGMLIDVRTGSGYDTHILGPGDGVILCGVKIPHQQSLQGHSDADVGLHALTDALLGTIGAGDIGSHFPPTDPEWKGASSDRFLEHAVALVGNAGGSISNLDVTIICEAPKIGPHRDAMRKEIARIVGIENLTRISVKATTNEKVGFIGRGEGIAALATATVVFGS